MPRKEKRIVVGRTGGYEFYPPYGRTMYLHGFRTGTDLLPG